MGLREAWESFLWAFTLNRRVFTNNANNGLTYVASSFGGAAGNAHTMVVIRPINPLPKPLPQPLTVRIQCLRKPKKISVFFMTVRGGWPVTGLRPKVKGGSVYFRLKTPAFMPPDEFQVHLHGVTAKQITTIEREL
jgi:hypothetical protein